MRRLAPLLLIFTLACGSETTTPLDQGASTGPDGGAVSTDAGASATDAGFEDSGRPPDAGPPADAGSPDSGATDAGTPTVADPEQAGPLPVIAHAETIRVMDSGNDLPLDCRYPSTRGGPFPLVVINHGFQLPASQYTRYAEHLAGFGYVACTADFAAGFVANHAENASDVIAGLERLLAANQEGGHPLAGQIDATKIGMMGHSLGGKVSFLVAARDPRVGAVFGLDPVDTSMFCDPARCPDASALLPFPIPIGVLGETLDSTGGQACAPAADNFETFYSAANSPAVQIDVLGAGHMSFIDDPASCGLPCRLCNTPSADHADVIRAARALTVAFFERHLRGEVAYDDYLTGPTAQMRYVTPGLATIQSK